MTKRKSWSIFKRFVSDRTAVLLSPFPSPSRLDSFRGIEVRFHRNREAVLAYVSRHLAPTREPAHNHG